MEELTQKVKDFILWLHDPKSPFDTVFNGTDRSMPRIYYRKGQSDKTWLLDEVYDYYCKSLKQEIIEPV